jgi:hypothetical protein
MRAKLASLLRKLGFRKLAKLVDTDSNGGPGEE